MWIPALFHICPAAGSRVPIGPYFAGIAMVNRHCRAGV
ncbi:hypothetical protein HNQ81_003372 [Desulfoprunum benzoelyticum]|uniref:Uncharacterized protein n=1 Tax=Desulfoprunum benzoelyticum TaxID=1506996 RepID=A0A840UXS2_9BACT|nr:hypothetical protein [Desulfoprunum benzoelyticum]